MMQKDDMKGFSYVRHLRGQWARGQLDGSGLRRYHTDSSVEAVKAHEYMFRPLGEPGQFANRPSDMRTACDNSYSQASTSNKAGVSCNCKKSCDSRRCRCFENGLECSIYCHSDDHDCGNMKPVAQRTGMSLLPRPAWDNLKQVMDEPAPVQPQPRRILRAKSVLARTTVNRTASGLAGQHVLAHPPPSSILQSRPPHHTAHSD